MRRLLDLLAGPATRAPRATLTLLVLATVGFAALASQLQVSTSLEDFAPEGGLGDTLEAVDDRFGAGTSFQLIVDTGPGGDLLTPEGLALGERLQDALAEDDELAPLLADDALDRPAVLTYAFPFAAAAEAVGTPLADLDPTTLDAVVAGLLDDEQAAGQVAALLSGDLETDPPRARGGLGVVELRPGLDADQRATASEAVERVAADVQAPGVRVSVLSDAVIQRAISEGIARDIPVLLSLSLALVVLVLASLFRTVSDVLVGLLGLLASIVWMVGLAALFGPTMLGLVGPFSQISIAVPVLLVGLGVDYSVHLTTRYREQQRRGDRPERAARTTLHTVGIALVLATAATVGGFLANLATPLPPIADLGIFSALGILAAFLLFSLAVPAVRVLLDRRRGASAPDQAGAGASPSRWTDALTRLTVHHPALVLAVTAVVLTVATVSALGLGTEFDEREFLPDGAAVTATIDRTETLFGGDVGEQTYVVVDGDPSDPGFLAAAAALEDELAAFDEVRRVGDRAQITSPFELVDRLGDRGLRVRDQLASDLAAWADPEAAAADVPVPDELDPATLEQQLDGTDPQELGVPPEVVDEVDERLPPDRSPVVALATTADPAVIRDAVRGQLREQVLAERPDGVDPVTFAELAALPRDQLDVATLEAAGILDALAPEDVDALRTLADLEAAGWAPDAPSRAGGDVAAQVAVAERVAPDELAGTLASDGVLLTASTAAGEDGAADLAARIEAAGTVVEDVGGDVTAVSQPLVNAEIIDELSAAQLLSIAISVAIAGALLVLATLVSDRSVALGLIGVAPAIAALVLVLGTMRAVGLSFNALTATVASIAVGIGVPYGIHLTNRFRASLPAEPTVEAAIGDTLRHTGGALAGSAVTTGLAFGVLGLSTSVPLRQFGLVSAMMITYALLSCLLLQPTLLALWARRRVSRRGGADVEPERAPATV